MDSTTSPAAVRSLRFHIGPFTYLAVVVAERPVDEVGNLCEGIIDFEDHRIELFAAVRGRRRLNLLLHELAHGWRRHFPHTSQDEEDQADMAALYAQQVIQDLDEQGGLAALDALEPGPTLSLAGGLASGGERISLTAKDVPSSQVSD